MERLRNGKGPHYRGKGDPDPALKVTAAAISTRVAARPIMAGSCKETA